MDQFRGFHHLGRDALPEQTEQQRMKDMVRRAHAGQNDLLQASRSAKIEEPIWKYPNSAPAKAESVSCNASGW